MQFFEWESSAGDIPWWKHFENQVPRLKELGITQVWLPRTFCVCGPQYLLVPLTIHILRIYIYSSEQSYAASRTRIRRVRSLGPWRIRPKGMCSDTVGHERTTGSRNPGGKGTRDRRASGRYTKREFVLVLERYSWSLNRPACSINLARTALRNSRLFRLMKTTGG